MIHGSYKLRTRGITASAVLCVVALAAATVLLSTPAFASETPVSPEISAPALHAPEPAAATLSGMGLAGVGWYLGKARARRRFRAYAAQPAGHGGLLVYDADRASALGHIEEIAYLGVKRALDAVAASVALAVLSPLLVMLALAVKLDSAGPIFYRQERLGEGRRRFKLIKFRSMCTDADRVLQEDENLKKEFESLYKLKNDPRITRVGRFLRRTSLDELPQLINVVLGDISLVGPRPIVEAECEKYWPFEERLFSVKPGVTGLWQISGRNDTSYDERVRLDMRYIAERSLYKDLSILFGTLPALLKRDNGAY